MSRGFFIIFLSSFGGGVRVPVGKQEEEAVGLT